MFLPEGIVSELPIKTFDLATPGGLATDDIEFGIDLIRHDESSKDYRDLAATGRENEIRMMTDRMGWRSTHR